VLHSIGGVFTMFFDVPRCTDVFIIVNYATDRPLAKDFFAIF